MGWRELILLTAFLAVYVLADLYMLYRFARKADKTAAAWHWFNLKWILASQTEQVAERIPAIKKDLSEVYGFKDDGKTT